MTKTITESANALLLFFLLNMGMRPTLRRVFPGVEVVIAEGSVGAID
jgi:hypothetical protein